jgi:hypothetical protein
MTRYIRIRGVSNPQLPCVYVLRQMDQWSRRSAVPLKVCDTAIDALILAIAVRNVFLCPVWVANLRTPADVRTFAAQSFGDSMRANGLAWTVMPSSLEIP